VGRALQTLVAAGHRLSDILHRRQPGFPYRGWSKPQFDMMLRLARAEHERRQRNFIAGVHLGAAAIFGKEAGAHYKRAMKELGGDDA